MPTSLKPKDLDNTDLHAYIIANELIIDQFKQIISLFKQQKRLQNMLSFIHQNYYKSISLQDIAESGNMSIAQCYHYFKMIVKMSPYDYLIHYRLLKSIDYLLGSTHYIQTFKKAYTLSPNKYQKNIEKGIYNNANSFSFFHLTISIQHK